MLFVPNVPFAIKTTTVAPAFVSSAVQTSTSNTVVFNKPTGKWINGNIIVGCFVYDTAGSSGAVTLPSGWTLIDNEGPTFDAFTAYHVCGGSEPSTYTFQPTSDTAIAWCGIILEYSGQNATTPINAHSAKVANATKSITATAVSTTNANCRVVYFGQGYNSTNTITAMSTPSTFSLEVTEFLTPVDSSGAGLGTGSWDKAVAATGSVVSQTSTITTAGTAANTAVGGFYIAISP